MPASESFLYQERSIFDHLFDVALQGGELLRPRMLLVNALENETRRRPDIAREYLEKLALLQQRHALPPGAGSDLVAKGVADGGGEGEPDSGCVNRLHEAIRRLPPALNSSSSSPGHSACPSSPRSCRSARRAGVGAGIQQCAVARHHHLRSDPARIPRLVPAHSRLDAREVRPVVLLARRRPPESRCWCSPTR